jgi:hypothetical protein
MLLRKTLSHATGGSRSKSKTADPILNRKPNSTPDKGEEIASNPATGLSP